jgi:hypothetical protein
MAEAVQAGRRDGVALGTGPMAVPRVVAAVVVGDARGGVGAIVAAAGPVAADGIPVGEGLGTPRGRAADSLGTGTGVGPLPCAGSRDGASVPCVAGARCAGPTGWP